MSQRDQFAREAMSAIISNERVNPYGCGNSAHYDDIAQEAYQYADAMLIAREIKSKRQKIVDRGNGRKTIEDIR